MVIRLLSFHHHIRVSTANTVIIRDSCHISKKLYEAVIHTHQINVFTNVE